MDVRDAIIKRRSIRNYTDKSVSQELINEIINSARYTPSSGNIQNWQIIVVREEKTRKELSIASLKQSWMEQAPVHLVICNILDKIEHMYGERGKDLYSIQNCSALIQNILLLATEKGLATCWVSAFEENMVSRILRIPSNARPEAIITLGYPNEEPEAPIRFNCQDITFHDKWGNRESAQKPRKSILNFFKKK